MSIIITNNKTSKGNKKNILYFNPKDIIDDNNIMVIDFYEDIQKFLLL